MPVRACMLFIIDTRLRLRSADASVRCHGHMRAMAFMRVRERYGECVLKESAQVRAPLMRRMMTRLRASNHIRDRSEHHVPPDIFATFSHHASLIAMPLRRCSRLIFLSRHMPPLCCYAMPIRCCCLCAPLFVLCRVCRYLFAAYIATLQVCR